MKVVEIFNSCQGEGRLIGTPSTFIRLAGCNRHCSWCDTKYALLTSDGHEASVADLLQFPTLHHVVITGGEPLLQAAELRPYLLRLKAHVTIETNATIYSNKLQPFVNLWSLSPKLGSSGHKPDKGTIRRFLDHHHNRLQFKFVISDARDLLETRDLIRDMGLKDHYIVLQPNGMTRDLMVTYRWIEGKVLSNDFWLGLSHLQILPQLHVLAWGRERRH